MTPDELESTASLLGIGHTAVLPSADRAQHLLGRVPLAFARANGLLPLGEEDGRVMVAVSGASSLLVFDELQLIFGKPVEAVLAPPSVVVDAINHAYAGFSGTAREVLQELEGEDLTTVATQFNDPQDLLDLTDEAPAHVRLCGIDGEDHRVGLGCHRQVHHTLGQCQLALHKG